MVCTYFQKKLKPRHLLNQMNLLVKICPEKIWKRLCYILIILLIGHLVAVYLQYFTQEPGRVTETIIEWFDFNAEGNFPTLYSTILFLIAAILLYLIALNSSEKRIGKWQVLSLIFLFMGADESIGIHEKWIFIVRSTFSDLEIPLPDLFHYGWIIPYGILLIILFAYFFQFFKNLPRKTIKLFFLSATIFINGAIVMEMFGGRHNKLYGGRNLTFTAYYTCEELLEMVGLIVFIYALLEYLHHQGHISGHASQADKKGSVKWQEPVSIE